jgi:hypothetical protein
MSLYLIFTIFIGGIYFEGNNDRDVVKENKTKELKEVEEKLVRSGYIHINPDGTYYFIDEVKSK